MRISEKPRGLLHKMFLFKEKEYFFFFLLLSFFLGEQNGVDSSKMIREETALLLCGSFNPITNLHLRMLEIARDYLVDNGHNVFRAFISPVHDNYGKAGLISITHRTNMIKNALKTSDWIQLSSWESEQPDWTRTVEVLRYHQERLNSLISDTKIKNMNGSRDVNGNPANYKVTVKMVCGGDVINSFSVPGLWSHDDIQRILTEHGLVVITRSGYDIDNIIYENDDLYHHKKNIIIVKEHIENDVSSSKIRKACSRGQSIKYLVQDEVEKYIKAHKLYTSSRYKYKSCTKDMIRIPADLFNDYKKYPQHNKKLPVISTCKKQNTKVQRKRKIKETVTTKKRSKKSSAK